MATRVPAGTVAGQLLILGGAASPAIAATPLTWWRDGARAVHALLVAPFAIALSVPVQAGEEIAWRGYALPRLADRIGLPGASARLYLLRPMPRK